MTRHDRRAMAQRELAYEFDRLAAEYRVLARDLALDLDVARDRVLALARAVDRLLALDLNLDFVLDLDVDVARTLANARDLDRDLAFDLDVDRAFDLNRNHALVRALASDIDLAIDLARARDLALDLNRALKLALAIDVDPDLDLDPDLASALASQLENRASRLRAGGQDRVEAQVLAWLSRCLPAAERARFVAEERGNLSACECWWQRVDRLADLTMKTPRLAWMMRREEWRRRA